MGGAAERPRMSCGAFRASPPGHANLLLPRPPGFRHLGLQGLRREGGVTRGRPTTRAPAPLGPQPQPRLRAPPPLRGWVRTAERGRRKQGKPEGRPKKGVGVGAAWAPGVAAAPAPQPPKGSDRNPAAPGPRSAASSGAVAALQAGRRAPTAAAFITC